MNMRMTRRGAGILIALMLIAVPAAAAVMTQSFVTATATLDDTCFDLIRGDDADFTDLVTFDPSGTVVAADGSAQLVQAAVGIKGQVGDRMVYTDVARFTNDCGSVVLELLSTSDPAGGNELEPAVGPGSIWDFVDIRVYVQDVGSVAATSNPLDNPGDWEELLTVINGSVTESGFVLMPNASERRLAFVVDTDSSYVPDLATPANNELTWRWTAKATYN